VPQPVATARAKQVPRAAKAKPKGRRR
jgi:hypothetical protein